jgi:hypothetical protein
MLLPSYAQGDIYVAADRISINFVLQLPCVAVPQSNVTCRLVLFHEIIGMISLLSTFVSITHMGVWRLCVTAYL